MALTGDAWPALLVLYLLAAYLVGSIPTAYLLVRWHSGVDIREFGSGNVGGNNAGHLLGHWARIAVGLTDIAKAALPTWLALEVLGWGNWPAVAAGLSAMVGHNWSIFLGFTGGRGIGAILGTMVVLFPPGALLLLVSMGISWRLHSTAGSSVGLLVLPILSAFLAQPVAVTTGCLAMIGITAIKRLEANGRPLPQGPARRRVIWRRLWLDRDIKDHEAWLARRPETPTSGATTWPDDLLS